MLKKTLTSIMQEVIAEAEKSISEDNRPHPKVGAILTDKAGNILLRAHRGEDGAGGHAEFTIFKKCDDKKLDLSDKILFVSLEPCTRRGKDKIPCAVRVAGSGIRELYIGTADPNPDIIGRGENYLLSRGLKVERFPFHLAQQLRELNAEVFAQHEHLIAPVVDFDPIIDEVRSGREFGDIGLHGNREGLLQSTLDHIVFSRGQVRIFSGALSWLRELQLGLLSASLRGDEVRVLCQKGEASDPEFKRLIEIARASGAGVGLINDDAGLRGTIVGDKNSRDVAITIERSPALHATLLRKPHEASMVNFLSHSFDQMWDRALEYRAVKPILRPLELRVIAEALRKGVRAYEGCDINIEAVDFSKVQYLSKNVERFKLYRIGVLENLRALYSIGAITEIIGSPWMVIPPIVEVDQRGNATVVDGMHRAYYWLERNKSQQDAIVIRTVEVPLPAVPSSNINRIAVSNEKWPRERRYAHYREEYFRPIRSSLERALRARQ